MYVFHKYSLQIWIQKALFEVPVQMPHFQEGGSGQKIYWEIFSRKTPDFVEKTGDFLLESFSF
jgi:hypothetical protein